MKYVFLIFLVFLLKGCISEDEDRLGFGVQRKNQTVKLPQYRKKNKYISCKVIRKVHKKSTFKKISAKKSLFLLREAKKSVYQKKHKIVMRLLRKKRVFPLPTKGEIKSVVDYKNVSMKYEERIKNRNDRDFLIREKKKIFR